MIIMLTEEVMEIILMELYGFSLEKKKPHSAHTEYN